jgi:hypothetical protein
MQVSYDLTRDDLYAFQWRASHRAPIAKRSRRNLYLYLFLALFLLAIVPAISAEGFTVSDVSFSFLFISFPIVASIAWLLEKRMMRRTILTLLKEEEPEKGQLGAHAITLDDHGVMETTAVGEMRVSWHGINRVEEDPNYIYIYTAPAAAFVIPRRSFASPEESNDFYRFASSHSQLR